jgi:Holliday junction resolvasome RuvABC endonuclease subunit
MGLDLAAAKSGVALPDGTTRLVAQPKIKPSGRARTLVDDLQRMAHIADQITAYLAAWSPDLILIEDYTPGIKSAAAHRLAEIAGVVRLACFRSGARVVLVNPQHLKIYATGKGGAEKRHMALEAWKRTGLEFGTDDECDAWWLHAMGRDYLGHPLFDLPGRNREMLTGPAWATPKI